MKKLIIAAGVFAMALPLMAQQTNTAEETKSSDKEPAAKIQPEENAMPVNETPDEGVRREERGPARPAQEDQRDLGERSIRLMYRVLNEIGVSEEQRKQIVEVQNEHNKQMRDAWGRMDRAMRKLSELQNEDATEEEINAAIDEIAASQGDQLKAINCHRMNMEKILGKEKYELLMQKALQEYRERGRPPSPVMPPRPQNWGERDLNRRGGPQGPPRVQTPGPPGVQTPGTPRVQPLGTPREPENRGENFPMPGR